MGGILESFLGYYRRFLGEFWEQLWSTWRTEVWPAVLIAALVFVLSYQHDINAKTALLYTAEASGIYLAGWGIYHLIRTPWKLDNEEKPASAHTLGQTLLMLSTEVLDFAYERLQNAPVLSSYPDIQTDEGRRTLVRDKRQHGREMVALQGYEVDTLGMYEYKFKRRIDAAIKDVKDRGIAWERDWDVAFDITRWQPPFPETIKVIGRHLSTVADTLAHLESS